MSAPGDMKSKLNDLGNRFLQRTLGELMTMREVLVKLRGGDASAAEALRHLAHKMHGTGATLGFNSISEEAGRLERLVESAPDDHARLTGHVDALDTEVRAVAKERGVNP